jgi:valyl-tRNA synthetase
MKSVQLPKAYNPGDFESRIYSLWMEHRSFEPAREGAGGPPFVIVIPPPNVTGVLHMGHGLNNVLQDILIRFYRMCGRPALWVPGTDHAGIATQNVVERQLRKEGSSRHKLGREAFVKRTWQVKEEHHKIIKRQLQNIGASCDWSRERFTLDEGLSKAVREVFVGLYEKELLYQGNYLINWCHSCGTALADDEVEHQEVTGKMYHYYYPLKNGKGKIEIATTRPETMLGDTAVAVHPDDPRYQELIGEEVELPLTDRVIPVITDAYVDKEFGTGVVKVTPAHDPNDWEIGLRHDLPRINILNPDGTLNENVPRKYRNMDVRASRKAVVEDLKTEGLFIKEVDHKHQVGHCYRCDTIIEPYLSKQWFVRMEPLARKALKALHDGEIRFYPKKWENTYTHWLTTIRDWCISRQLWWGHRIPVWYCDDCGEIMVRREDPTACSACGSTHIHQDEDVLDTWFSSWLWPFSTLGWPEQTEDVETFFPTSALVTAYDIIFFWVARMIMAGEEFMGKAPFRDIYIHGLIRDKQGRKMSKSLGNGIDPLEIVDEYGADALKFTLAFQAAWGQDILIDKESFKLGSKFANKIWNATRYLLMNLEGRELVPFEEIRLDDIDRWVLHRFTGAAGKIRNAVENYRFNDAGQTGYEFFWNDFCDWYIEASKLHLLSHNDAEKDRIVSLLMHILEMTLRLLHPFVSFVTEEIYQKLPNKKGLLLTRPYPEVIPAWKNEEIEAKMQLFQELVRAVRTLRSEFAVAPAKKIKVHVKIEPGCIARDFFTDHEDLMSFLTNASELTISEKEAADEGAVPIVGSEFEAYVYIKNVIDVPAEVEKLKKELDGLTKLIKQTEGKLSNQKFLDNAPQEIVEKEQGKAREFKRRSEKIEGYITELNR